MDGGQMIGEFVKVIGGAGVGVSIMYMWIKHLLKENTDLKSSLNTSQEARVEELKNILPLLTEASKGLQEVITDNKSRDNTLIEKIIDHINKTAKDLGSKCKT